MPTISSTLSKASRALQAHQSSISVASNNVANVNTPGYARQRAELVSLRGVNTVNGRFGEGVDVETVRSMRDPIVEQQVRHGLAEQGWYDTESSQLAMIETELGTLDETGLAGALDNFWNSWQDLSGDPSSNAQRNIVRETARNLTYRLNALSDKLANQENLIIDRVSEKVTRVNALTTEIARLNGDMVGVGNGRGEIDDRRSQLLDELATLTGADYRVEPDGTVAVFIGSVNVVSHNTTIPIKTATDVDGNIILMAEGGTTKAQLQISSGEIGALQNVRNEELKDIRSYLDDFATSLVNDVNAVHRQGYGLDGLNGRNFFDSNTSGINDIAIDQRVEDDLNVIAASSDGLTGDSGNALAIAELQIKTDNHGKTLGDAIVSAMGWIGARVVQSEDLYEGASLALQQAESWRDNVSGVSLDEEMALIVQYQHAYNAAARIVSLVDSMLETVIRDM